MREALRDNCIEGTAAAPDVPAVTLDRAHLEELLLRFSGKVAEMARHAGVSRPRMYRLLWAEGLDPAPFRRLRDAQPQGNTGQ